MIDDVRIIAAALRAERLKAAVPHLTVSIDAIFGAIILGKQEDAGPFQQTKRSTPVEAPRWFNETLKTHRGKAVEVGEFAVLAGRDPAPFQERIAIGRWLRASGRMPRRWGGRKLYDL